MGVRVRDERRPHQCHRKLQVGKYHFEGASGDVHRCHACVRTIVSRCLPPTPPAHPMRHLAIHPALNCMTHHSILPRNFQRSGSDLS